MRGGTGDNRFISDLPSAGVKSKSQTNQVDVTSGGVADSEFIVSVIYSAELNEHVIGYRQASTGTWTWGAVEAFVSWVTNPTGVMGIFHNASNATNFRHLSNYSGAPPGTTTTADKKAWIEVNAESEILKKEG